MNVLLGLSPIADDCKRTLHKNAVLRECSHGKLDISQTLRASPNNIGEPEQSSSLHNAITLERQSVDRLSPSCKVLSFLLSQAYTTFHQRGNERQKQEEPSRADVFEHPSVGIRAFKISRRSHSRPRYHGAPCPRHRVYITIRTSRRPTMHRKDHIEQEEVRYSA